MSAPLYSPSWYRVAGLRPRLRGHVEVHRQPQRDDLGYMLQDHSTGRFYRFNPSAHDIIGRMDGKRSVHEIWESATAQAGDDAPTQDETIALLGRLHAVDALQLSVPPDCLELFRRQQRQRAAVWKRPLKNPMNVRLPLLDPERFLGRLLPIVGPAWSVAGLVVWLPLVAVAMGLAAVHWPELQAQLREQALAPRNLMLLWLIYPLVKMLHELGHAITTRKWGGEVHEMGITLLVLMPIPYVDASAAWAFRDKRKRMLVGAAGIIVELFLAALAMFVWVSVEPGLVHAAAFNVMLIAGLSTLVFNGNPLLRFDAYYVLKDALEIPNLGPRSTRQLGYLVQRYLFGVTGLESPATQRGEQCWLTLYGVASGAYRIAITFTIILFVAGKFFAVGVILALWAAGAQIVLPLVRLAGTLLFGEGLQRNRVRAVAVSTGALIVVTACIFAVPVPSATRTEGVVWLPDDARVRAGAAGFVRALLVAPNARVAAGEPLLEMADPFLAGRIEVLEAELVEIEARHDAQVMVDRVKAAITKDEIRAKEADLEHQREQLDRLLLRSPADGVFVLGDLDTPVDRYLRQGEAVGYVIDQHAVTVRVVVPQSQIGLVREHIRGVDVRLVRKIATTIPARISNVVPAARNQLPSKALGVAGGGRIVVDPADEDGLRAMQTVFQFDLRLDEAPAVPAVAYTLPFVGERAYVRFDHGAEPLSRQWLRAGRQLFLRRFGV